ncbi:DUF2198 family protein [Anaerobacillus sp. CMMVII]|uniref:CsbA family protein n=1 Tax=Anaerobacillus sp. CMMVII TaxID=2755588 RepID=UPI0021B7C986|nr:CsbA family protein [Anaerobacillus sp. CMMVII]MCT8140179.1 DUF2198 family protein [Anaerobacillus sp. CMMVII]
MLTILLALTLPFIMMLFFTRVSYSKIGALMVTLMIVIFAFDGLHQSWPVIITGAISIVVGYIVSLRIQRKNKGV